MERKQDKQQTGPNGAEFYARFSPACELDRYRQIALARMMAGMLLSFTGLLLGLVSLSVSAQSTVEPEVAASGFGWLGLGLIGLILALLIQRGWRSGRDRRGVSDGHKTSIDDQSSGEPVSSAPRVDGRASLLALLDDYFDRSRRQKAFLTVMLLGLDTTPGPPGKQNDQHEESPDHDRGSEPAQSMEALRLSISGLTSSRGASTFQYSQPEFVVVATDLLPDESIALAEDINQAVAELLIPGCDAEAEVITTSIGLIVTRPDERQKSVEVLNRAEQILAQARQRGGNRVESLVL